MSEKIHERKSPPLKVHRILYHDGYLQLISLPLTHGPAISTAYITRLALLEPGFCYGTLVLRHLVSYWMETKFLSLKIHLL